MSPLVFAASHAGFSEYFRELDKTSMKTITHEYYVNKEYRRIMDQW
jgi:hypothetical protein